MRQEKDNQETEKRKRIIIMLLLLLLFLFFMIIIVIFLLDDLNPNTATPNDLYDQKNIISNNEKNHGNTPKPNQDNNTNTDTTPKEEETPETEVTDEETPAPAPIPIPKPKPIPSVPPIEHVDREAPICTLSTAVVSPTNITNIVYTVTISEDFNGDITADDIVVAFGEVKDIYHSGRTYTFQVESDQSGLQSVYIRANAITDKANNKNPKSNTLDTMIDIIVPTVSFSNTQEKLAMDPSQTSLRVSTLISANDLGGSGLDTLQYAWNDSEETEPNVWTIFSNGEAITQNCPVGNSYLWVKLQDRAGNSSILLKKYTVEYAVAELNGVLYLTLQDAIDAAPVEQHSVITMLANVTENTTNTKDVSIVGNDTITGTMTNQNILDINGVHVVAESSKNAIINNKNLTVTSGSILSDKGSGILNNATGTVVITGGTVTSENNLAIFNKGNANVMNAEIVSEKNTAIRNIGSLIVEDGSTIRTGLNTTASTIYNDPTGNIDLQGGVVNSLFRSAVSNYGSILMSGNAIIENNSTSVSSGYACMNNYGTLELRDGVIKANAGIAIQNKGTTTIKDNAFVQNFGNYRSISNYNTLIMEGGNIYSDSNSAVICEAGSDYTFTDGTLTNGTNNVSTRVWNKGGNITIGGNVNITNNSKTNPPVRNELGTLTLQDAAVITTPNTLQPALLNNGTFTMNGGKLESNYYSLQNASIATITGGEITSPSGIAILTALKSNTTITGGNISAFKSNAIKSMSNTYIQGGTITAQGASLTLTTATLLTTNAGMFEITGGNISSEKGYALYLNASPGLRSYIKDNAYLTNNSATIPTVVNAATVNYIDKVGLIMTGGSVINQNSNGYAVANASSTMKVTLSGGITLPRNNIKGDID